MNIPDHTTLSPATLDDPDALAQVIYYRTSARLDGSMSSVPLWHDLAKETQEKYLSLARDIADQRRRFTPPPPEDVPDVLLSRGDMQRWVMDELAISASVADVFARKLREMVMPYVDAYEESQQIRDRFAAVSALQYSLGLEAENMASVSHYLRDSVSQEAATMLDVASAMSTAIARRLRETMTGETPE